MLHSAQRNIGNISPAGVAMNRVMNKEIVLIVDDDPLLCKALAYQLQKRQYQCIQAHDPDSALEHLTSQPRPNVIILDYFLGSKTLDGLALCRRITAISDIPVIMLTSNNTTQTIVSCLDAGAVQYIVKPYEIEELTARLRATIRHRHPDAKNQDYERTKTQSVIQLDSLKLNVLDRQLSCNDTNLSLTEKELAVLEVLMQKPGTPVSRSHLYRVVYGKGFDYESRAIDVLVGRVRKKLESVGCKIHIWAVRGEGYILQSSEAPHDISQHNSGN
jgi:DNA-binding response OmpR family regulator